MKTNEQARQEAIKAAWGDAYNFLYPYMDVNGWVRASNLKHYPKKLPFKIEDVVIDGSDFYRPLHLLGIDNNNGWTRIEPDGSNLPPFNGDGKYECRTKGGNRVTLNGANAVRSAFRHSVITHYRPVPPPIPEPVW